MAGRGPQRVAAARRAPIEAAAPRAGDLPGARTLALVDGTVLVTTAPQEGLAMRAALGLARARWQIERRGKRWTHEGHRAAWRRAALVAARAASRRGVAAGGRIGPRRGRPSLHQLLTDPALGGLA